MTEKNPFFGATFAERKAIRLGTAPPKAEAAEPDKGAQAEAKQVDDESAGVEDKQVTKKATSRKSTRKPKS